MVLGYGAIAFSPWFLLPFAWFFTGTALTGFFVVAHDCGHRSFANRRWVNDAVGHTLMLPLIYPFHSWRLLHDHHHCHTNKLDVDNAWEPWQVTAFQQSPAYVRIAYQAIRGRLWWLGSILHWAVLHFNPHNVAPRHHSQVRFSITLVYVFSALFFPTMIWFVGFWGLAKFWLFPWLGYHFWMSTFTLVHHTLPDIPFRPAAVWNAFESQVAGTVHCAYPRWVEVLCHDINVHLPHHVSVAVPWYNLRLAHGHLKQHWGDYIREEQFSWKLIKKITDCCHLYHPERTYQAFRDLA